MTDLADVLEAFAAQTQTLEDVRGDLYLWRIGELTAEEAMDAIRKTLEEAPS